MDKRDERNNNELKEHLGNAALETLRQGVDYNDLTGLTIVFGYLFDIVGHGIEALFKMITDMGIHYFAVQKSALLRIDITEEMYEQYVEMYG